MRFCTKCGSYMKETQNSVKCGKCGRTAPTDIELPETSMEKKEPSNSIYIVDNSKNESLKVSQVCPRCGVSEAFRWVTRVSGDHAGISTERIIERFKCVKCSHSWTKTA